MRREKFSELMKCAEETITELLELKCLLCDENYVVEVTFDT